MTQILKPKGLRKEGKPNSSKMLSADSPHWINAAIIPRGGLRPQATAQSLLWSGVHLIYPIKVFAINPVKAND